MFTIAPYTVLWRAHLVEPRLGACVPFFDGAQADAFCSKPITLVTGLDFLRCAPRKRSLLMRICADQVAEVTVTRS